MYASPKKYNAVSQILHWVIVALIALQYLLAEAAELAERSDVLVRQLAFLGNHKSIGITILGLAVIRLCWRLATPRPLLPLAMPQWQQWLARVTHYMFYFLLIALPLTGWLGSSASAYTVSWFGLAELPDLLRPNPALKQTLYAAHELFGNVMVVLIGVHVAASIKHHWLDKDDVLTSMLSPLGVGIFIAVFFAGALTFDTIEMSKRSASAPDSLSAQDDNLRIESTAPGSQAVIARQSELPVWSIDYDKSFLRFRGEQAGASFEGLFSGWQARIQLDSTKLTQSVIDVLIELDSVNTRDEERDSTLLQAEFFAVEQFPIARFVTTSFQTIGTEESPLYRADARLNMKGVTVPVRFEFNLEARGPNVLLRGFSRLDRLALGVGTGDWLDTDWLGQYVEVSVEVVAEIN